MELLSITLIFRQRVSYRIYLVTPTGYLGIAVPPSLAHFSHDFCAILFIQYKQAEKMLTTNFCLDDVFTLEQIQSKRTRLNNFK